LKEAQTSKTSGFYSKLKKAVDELKVELQKLDPEPLEALEEESKDSGEQKGKEKEESKTKEEKKTKKHQHKHKKHETIAQDTEDYASYSSDEEPSMTD